MRVRNSAWCLSNARGLSPALHTAASRMHNKVLYGAAATVHLQRLVVIVDKLGRASQVASASR